MDYINPHLDREAIRNALARDGRVLVRDFFEPTVVEALAAAMDAVDWRLLFRDDSGDRKLLGEELRALTPGTRMELVAGIQRLAERDFQFLFHSHSMVDTARRGEADLLTRFVRWMADEEFMSAMRALSGMDEINRVYAQATKYSPGNFLLLHNDETSVERRRLAYVINLTRRWRADWGGLLHFTDDEGNVADTFFPHFNSVALFTVPQKHFVSYVAPYAVGERLAVTGWLIAA
jgi:Rps23 Pro-64 3,4-dihydroxylase Tpa1-like proline 4-hydroxylase